MLRIQLFGNFTIFKGDEPLLSGYTRKNKAVYLLIFLIVHRGQGFTNDELIELLYPDEDIDDLVNSLKIVVHRMRKLLNSLGLSGSDLIKNKKGLYSLNESCGCMIDCEVFTSHLKVGFAAENQDEKIVNLEKAINLYKGDFLTDLAQEKWVSGPAMEYKNGYHLAIKEMFNLLKEKQDYNSMLEITQAAVEHLYGDESIHIMRIYSLYKMGLLEEALSFYEHTVDMLFNKLGVNPSKELIELYNKISSKLSPLNEDIKVIQEEISQNIQQKGAYYSNFQNFIDSYHPMVRATERTGFTAFLMECSLDKHETADHLKKAIQQSLRKSDSFSRYSPSQYVILLIGTSLENCNQVYERIEKMYYKLAGQKAGTLKHSVAPAIDGITERG